MAISNKLLNDGERVVVTTREHPKALIVPFLALALVLTAAIWAAAYVPQSGSTTIWYAVIAAVAIGLLMWLSLIPFLRWLTTHHTFTNRRFIKRSGVLAKEGRTIPLNRISGVDFEMGVVDRLFGCGTLVVSDASANGSVRLNDIPRVEQVQLLVGEELARLAERGEGADDGT